MALLLCVRVTLFLFHFHIINEMDKEIPVQGNLIAKKIKFSLHLCKLKDYRHLHVTVFRFRSSPFRKSVQILGLSSDRQVTAEVNLAERSNQVLQNSVVLNIFATFLAQRVQSNINDICDVWHVW